MFKLDVPAEYYCSLQYKIFHERGFIKTPDYELI